MTFSWQRVGEFFLISFTKTNHRWFSKNNFIELMNVSRKEASYEYKERFFKI